MIHTYKYELIGGHIIVIANGFRFLIDTGAPSSVADSSPLEIAGCSHQAVRDYQGITPESLSTMVGTPINALIGVDILNQHDILIDPTAHNFCISEDELLLAGQSLELENFMGIPIIKAIVGDDTVRMFFDTGAKLSHLNADITDAFQPIGTENDFHPGHGNFNTNIYDIPIEIASETIVLRVGNLPEALQMTLDLANTCGILGTAILETHKVIFAPRRKIMTLQRLGK